MITITSNSHNHNDSIFSFHLINWNKFNGMKGTVTEPQKIMQLGLSPMAKKVMLQINI